MQRMMHQHCVVVVVDDCDSVASPEEINVINSILPVFGHWEAENSTHKPPRQYLSFFGGPVTSHVVSTNLSSISKWDNQSCCFVRAEPNACNLVAASFNIER